MRMRSRAENGLIPRQGERARSPAQAWVLGGLLIVCFTGASAFPPDSTAEGGIPTEKRIVSFRNEVLPILKRHCLPCHAQDYFNPSELSLDTHEALMAGGRHGVPVVPGNSGKSMLYQMLGPAPPLGGRMPLDPKRKRGELSSRSLSDEEIDAIAEWIDQGAKNN